MSYRNTSSKDARLYGVQSVTNASSAPKPKNPISSSTTLSFTSALSSLISSASAPTSSASQSTAPIAHTSGRPRAARTKPDIFTTHNRNTKKRAAADLVDAENPATVGNDAAATALDDASWRRTKRKMAEKARLYAALKRGDVDDDAEKHMVDFDRKWAEQETNPAERISSSSSSSSSDEENEPLTTYTDEFGRTRTGTLASAQLAQRQHTLSSAPASDRFTARPLQPANLIFGDAVQAAAFDADSVTLAGTKHRDRSATPPDAVHYDAAGEVRTRGTGFFAFSRDEAERAAEMARLEAERRGTERVRAEGQARRDARKSAVEERRRLVKERKERVLADRFLDGLAGEVRQGGDDEGVVLVGEVQANKVREDDERPDPA